MNAKLSKILDWTNLNIYKLIIAAVAIVMGALIVTCSFAETVTVTWTHPTAYTNGASLPAADLQRTEIRCLAFTPTAGIRTTCPNAPAVANVLAPATTTAYNLGIVPPSGGLYELDARTVVDSNAVSAWSAPGTKIFVAVPPNPPSIVTIATVAWEIQVKPNGTRVVQVGTVPLGTACGAATFDGYYEIDPTDASLRGSYKGGVLVAYCGPA